MKTLLFAFFLFGAAVAKSNNEIEETEKFCEPGQVFKLDDFSTCKCTEDGTKAMCTLSSLARAKTSSKYCTPGSVFSPDNCNTCHCTGDGTEAVCTLMACLEKKPKAEQVCQPGTQFKDYCNTCFCDDDGSTYSCTRMFCDKEVWNPDGTIKPIAASLNVKEKQVCEPDSTFKDYCNTCHCSADGLTYMCTMMYCDTNLWNKDGTMKEELQTNADLVCEAGKTFSPDGCNTCICNEYGTEFACTLKLCVATFKQTPKAKQVEKWGPVYKQGDECLPGTSFYSECNQCVCTKTGKSAFCTLMFCPRAT